MQAGDAGRGSAISAVAGRSPSERSWRWGAGCKVRGGGDPSGFFNPVVGQATYQAGFRELSVVGEDQPLQYPTPEQSLPRVTEGEIMKRARTEQSLPSVMEDQSLQRAPTEQSLPRVTEDHTVQRAPAEQSLPAESEHVDASLSTLIEKLDREIYRLMMEDTVSPGPAPMVSLFPEIPDYEPAEWLPTSSPLAHSVLGHAGSRVSQAPSLKPLHVFFWIRVVLPIS